MIKNVIFDFGAILIPIDIPRTWESFETLGANASLRDQDEIFQKYEKGEISSREFVKGLQPHFFRKKIFHGDIKEAWNSMLDPLQGEIIPFLQKINRNYETFLLSNTNEFHVNHIREVAGPFLYKRFVSQFNEVYYSHKVGMRKPDKEIFQRVLDDHNLNPEETFFVDDGKKNTQAAAKLGIHTWHFKPEEDSIFDIKERLEEI